MSDEFYAKTASNKIIGRHLPSEDTSLSSNKGMVGGELISFGLENLPQSSFKPLGGHIEGFYANSFHFLSDKLYCFVFLKEDYC